jgi:glycosyltransferase involved in cell wall biosynthesis
MWQQCEFAKSFTEIGLFASNPLAAIYKYHQMLKQQHIDVVLNFGLRVELFSRMLTPAFSPNTRIISNIRSTDNDRNIFHTLADVFTQQSVSGWVANSKAGKQAFVKRELIDENDITVIYNFVSSTTIKPYEHTVDVLHPKIGVLANIRKLKGHYDLIDLCKQLHLSGIYPTFICGGLDHTNGHFFQAVSSAGLSSSFEFIGYVENKQLFFEQLDLFLLPSYLEGMPTVVLEAMSYGVPVVATHIDGIPEQIIHMQNGWLCAPGDIQAFVGAIHNLLQNDLLRKQFVTQSYNQLQNNFSEQVSMNKWLEIINCN